MKKRKQGMANFPKDRDHLIKWATGLIEIANNNERSTINTIVCLGTTISGIQLTLDKLKIQWQKEKKRIKRLTNTPTP